MVILDLKLAPCFALVDADLQNRRRQNLSPVKERKFFFRVFSVEYGLLTTSNPNSAHVMICVLLLDCIVNCSVPSVDYPTTTRAQVHSMKTSFSEHKEFRQS